MPTSSDPAETDRDAGASVEPVELGPDLTELLLSAGPDLGGRQALLTPHVVRAGASFYAGSDAYAEADANASGLDAVFAVPAAERRYLGEYSVTLIAMYGIAVASGVTTTSVTNVCKYLRQRFKRDQITDAVPGLPANHVRVTLSRVHDRDGLPGVDAVAIEGRPDDVVETVRTLLEAQSPQEIKDLPEVDGPDAETKT